MEVPSRQCYFGFEGFSNWNEDAGLKLRNEDVCITRRWMECYGL